MVSARTGEGLDDLVALIEGELPRPDITVDVLLPYAQGSLLSRIHADGEVLSLTHEAEGTLGEARVPPALAAELGPFARV